MFERNMLLMIAAMTLRPSLAGAELPVWPPAPDTARVAYLEEIRLGELTRESSLFAKLRDVLAGSGRDDRIANPFDVLVDGDHLFMVCQDLDALVVVGLEKRDYRLVRSQDQPLLQPIALCRFGDSILLSDSAAGRVYRYRDSELRSWIFEGLIRPTGLAALDGPGRLCVVDTGDHTLKIFDENGQWIETVGARSEDAEGFNFPTFATTTPNGDFLVNDTLNYRIRRLDARGRTIGAFGSEGNGPGSFARPKGIATDAAGHVYVVDSLFDNVQIFSPEGALLLVIGGRGDREGEFWSPAGISIFGDRIFVADTFNDRVQVLRYLGGER